MNIAESTRIVKEVQDEFMRGELEPEMIRHLNEEYPQAIPDWTKMKANFQVRLRKFRKRFKDIVQASLLKSSGTRRFRPGKEKSTLRKQKKNLEQLERQYRRSGCAVLQTWTEMTVEVTMSLGINNV
jgi:hypothetical protein